MRVSDRWIDTPPAPCHITGRDQPKAGEPYLVEEFHYAPLTRGPDGKPRMLPQIRPLVHAASQIRRVCDLPGSPFVLLTKDEFEAAKDIQTERDMLAARVEELEAELAEAKALEGAVDRVLSNGLMERLDARYSKKPGPKPKAAA